MTRLPLASDTLPVAAPQGLVIWWLYVYGIVMLLQRRRLYLQLALVAIGGLVGFAFAVWLLPVLLTRPSAGLSVADHLKAENDARAPIVAALAVLGAALITTVFAARAAYLTREGQITDRYTKAVEQLGSDHTDVRIGAIYALERIAGDSNRDHPTVMEVLVAYIRGHAGAASSGVDVGNRAPRPAPDVQAALNVIGRRNSHFDIERIDLTGTNLAGADLRYARLARALFAEAELADANLARANLQDVDLISAVLARASLSFADLMGADLRNADLRSADLRSADLRRANLEGVVLEDADLDGADLRGANLRGANLRGANLRGANLRGANLLGADLTNAVLTDADLTDTRLDGTT